MAFISSFVPATTASSSFAGQAVSAGPSTATASITMEVFSLDKYAKMNDDARPPPSPPSSSGMSAYYSAYVDSLKAKIIPFRGAKETETTAGMSVSAILAQSTPYFNILAKAGSPAFGAGGDPETQIGFEPDHVSDRYIAKCMTKQYKQSACPTGVYTTACTEGSTHGSADAARLAAVSAMFRMKQRSTAQKYGDFCESRRKGIILAHGCSYEESLVVRNVVSARTFVLGVSEKEGTCVRYAAGQSVEEKYMVQSVDMQYKALSAKWGTYDVMCCDGNTAGMAETKRVQSLSARFRSNQMSAGKKAQSEYDSRRYARSMFRSCSYEEEVFNKYPAVAASMRPQTARY